MTTYQQRSPSAKCARPAFGRCSRYTPITGQRGQPLSGVGDFGLRGYFEFGKQTGSAFCDLFGSPSQFGSDLFVGLASGYAPQKLLFARAQKHRYQLGPLLEKTAAGGYQAAVFWAHVSLWNEPAPRAILI